VHVLDVVVHCPLRHCAHPVGQVAGDGAVLLLPLTAHSRMLAWQSLVTGQRTGVAPLHCVTTLC